VIYEHDADAAPDAEFAPGRLAHLVAGNRGRLLDPRRTPVTITGLSLARGSFAVRVDAFEDTGAVWEIPFEDVGRFQFALAAAETEVEALEAAVARLDRPLRIEGADPAAALARIAEEREAAREWLGPRPDPAPYIARRAGEPALYEALAAFMESRGVADLERAFAERFVSNPRSGELVKGHAIVLAELGLCPFEGKVVRDAALFDGAGSRERRATHLLARLAFVQALWDAPVTLFRGGADPPAGSFVSATFSRAVAEANLDGRPGAVLWRGAVAPDRLFMTFMETEAMNVRYREAEAVVLGHQTVFISAP
jgi:hypothetical protein